MIYCRKHFSWLSWNFIHFLSWTAMINPSGRMQESEIFNLKLWYSWIMNLHSGGWFIKTDSLHNFLTYTNLKKLLALRCQVKSLMFCIHIQENCKMWHFQKSLNRWPLDNLFYMNHILIHILHVVPSMYQMINIFLIGKTLWDLEWATRGPEPLKHL